MPRTATWLPRLYDITRSVKRSSRSHYDRAELEKLFELQPRAAQLILEMLPTIPVGTSRLIEREALLSFLQKVHDAEDTSALFEQLRKERNTVPRPKLRTLVRTDLPPVNLTSLPDSIQLDRGSLRVEFETVQGLAEDLMWVARLLTEEAEEFAAAYEPQNSLPSDVEAETDDVRAMFAELEALEAERGLKTNSQ